jgi:hypothetical protein
MAGIPRTQKLIELHSTTAAVSAAFQCPANCVTLVKSAYFYNQSSAASIATLRLLPVGVAWALYLLNETLQQNALGSWQGWVALNPGDLIQIELTGFPMAGWVSGAVLLGPPPFPPAVTLLPA